MLIYTIGDYFALNRKDVHLIHSKNATEDNWEDGNDMSIDPRFQCYLLSLKGCIKQFGKDISITV